MPTCNDKIKKLIGQLGHASYRIRERATTKLIKEITLHLSGRRNSDKTKIPVILEPKKIQPEVIPGK